MSSAVSKNVKRKIEPPEAPEVPKRTRSVNTFNSESYGPRRDQQ